ARSTATGPPRSGRRPPPRSSTWAHATPTRAWPPSSSGATRPSSAGRRSVGPEHPSIGSAPVDPRTPRLSASRALVLGGLVATAAGAVGIAALRRWRRAGTGAPTSRAAARARLPVRGTGRIERRLHVARLGGRAGAAFALHRARRVFASVERQAELDERFQLQTAEQVTEALGHMK